MWFSFSLDSIDIHLQIHLAGYQWSAAGRCVRWVQRAVPQWPDNERRLLDSRPPDDPQCARLHLVSPGGGNPETYRRVVCHRGEIKGNAGSAAAYLASAENETAIEIPGKLAARKDENPVATCRAGESVRLYAEAMAGITCVKTR